MKRKVERDAREKREKEKIREMRRAKYAATREKQEEERRREADEECIFNNSGREQRMGNAYGEYFLDAGQRTGLWPRSDPLRTYGKEGSRVR